jgi:hypothetical protein
MDGQGGERGGLVCVTCRAVSKQGHWPQDTVLMFAGIAAAREVMDAASLKALFRYNSMSK